MHLSSLDVSCGHAPVPIGYQQWTCTCPHGMLVVEKHLSTLNVGSRQIVHIACRRWTSTCPHCTLVAGVAGDMSTPARCYNLHLVGVLSSCLNAGVPTDTAIDCCCCCRPHSTNVLPAESSTRIMWQPTVSPPRWQGKAPLCRDSSMGPG